LGQKRGKIGSVENLTIQEWLEDQADLAEALEILAEVEKEGMVSWEQIKAELEL
jgi:hypothetical protein